MAFRTSRRGVRGTPKTLTVIREGRRWYAAVACQLELPEPLAASGRAVGVDLGVASVLSTSEGEHYENPRYLQASAQRLASAQRSVAAKQKGSKRRRAQAQRVAAIHRKIATQRADHAHKLSRDLVNRFDLIAHEDLKIANLVRRPRPVPDADTAGSFMANRAAATAGLNRSIHDAGWGQLVAMLSYKAEEAGRQIVAVNPRDTSRTCSVCGHCEVANRVSQAEFRCQRCGHEAHADVNAAINILRAGLAQRRDKREVGIVA